MATANDATQQANRSGMDPQRLVVIFYLLTGVVVGLFVYHVLGALWARFGWRDPTLLEIAELRATGLLSIAVALGAVFGSWFNPRIRTLSLEVASELMKVTWPSWGETRTSTVAVVVASLVAAVILYGIDTLAFKLMVDWLPTVWGKL